ncbi:MAG: DNA translocase FtsK 4TM domain-containing protein [Clostridia bacterium]|nr:DNA translocase FtsK 4TM domain-containing protein [Clostridia bacterium]
MAAKKSTSKKAAAKVEAENNRKRQASAIILFAIAIFLLCLAVIPGGSGWYYLHCGFCGLLGISAFILPVIMIYIAVLFSMDKPVGSLKKEIWLCGILITLFSAALEIFIMDIDGESYWGAIKFGYEQGTNLKNGGVLGAIVGYPLEAFLEDVGAKIVIALLVFVFFMLVTGTTLMSLFKAIGSPVKKAKDSIQSAFEEDEDA